MCDVQSIKLSTGLQLEIEPVSDSLLCACYYHIYYYIMSQGMIIIGSPYIGLDINFTTRL